MLCSQAAHLCHSLGSSWRFHRLREPVRDEIKSRRVGTNQDRWRVGKLRSVTGVMLTVELRALWFPVPARA